MKEADIEKNLRRAIQEHERQRLKERLQALEGRKKRSLFSPRNLILMAAAIAILLATLMLLLPVQGVSGAELYAEYHTSYPNVLEPVRRTAEEPSLRMRAFEAYEAEDYAQAASLFGEIITDQYDPNVAFFQALSLLEAGQARAALAVFNQLQSADMRFSEQLLWYKALTELKLEMKPQAVETLGKMSEKEISFKKEAVRELLEQIDR